MRTNKLLKTNLTVSGILMIGFVLTAILSYKANYMDSLKNMERVSSLTAEGIYYQMTAMFTKPVNISLTMAHDSLLVNHLKKEEAHLDDEAYIQTTKTYLESYQKKYEFDSVFLVSTASGRYYTFNGVDRILTEGNPENDWYYDFLDSDYEYKVIVDNDEAEGAENKVTVFVNCQVLDREGKTVGVVGVGIRMEHLKSVLTSYEDRFNVQTCLVDSDGTVEISADYNGYENVDWFEIYDQQEIREEVLNWKEDTKNLELWDEFNLKNNKKSYIVTRYIPELSWHLLVEQNTGHLIEKMRLQILQIGIAILLIILVVLLTITRVIKRFDRQITKLVEEQQAMFRKATENMYENIYELNLTKDCSVGKITQEYFESLGAGDLPYSEALKEIAKKQIKEEFREGYLSTFSPEKVIQEYEKGINHLQHDFMITQDGKNYYWMRIDAYIFHSSEDQCIHMFIYRKNIDEEKRKQLQAETDEMTGFYTKTATERIIQRMLEENTQQLYAFFILDIDDFKTSNDQFGHDFGDFCIKEFVKIIQKNFRSGDILGRIGGDEFVAFLPVPNAASAKTKAEELVRELNVTCVRGSAAWKMSASIGIAFASPGETVFETLYHNADQALYQAKANGKNGFIITPQ